MRAITRLEACFCYVYHIHHTLAVKQRIQTRSYPSYTACGAVYPIPHISYPSITPSDAGYPRLATLAHQDWQTLCQSEVDERLRLASLAGKIGKNKIGRLADWQNRPELYIWQIRNLKNFD